jgi:hypothetical protein
VRRSSRSAGSAAVPGTSRRSSRTFRPTADAEDLRRRLGHGDLLVLLAISIALKLINRTISEMR